MKTRQIFIAQLTIVATGITYLLAPDYVWWVVGVGILAFAVVEIIAFNVKK